MIIYKETDEVLADVPVDDTSYRYRAVKGANEVNLNFSLAEPLDIPLGSYIYYEGIKYTLEEPPAITKKDSRNIAYKAVFSAPQARLNRYRFRNTVDGRLKFSLTAKPHEHLQMLVDNLNLREQGWMAGDCIDDVEKVVTYDYSTCAEALDMISEAFGVEWEIQNTFISLKKKVEYFEYAPLPLSYGRGNGFVSGVGRQNRSDEDSGLEILYAIGGDRNITPEQNTGGEKTGSPFPSIKPIPVKMEMPSFPVAKAAARTAAAQTAEIPNPAMGNTNLILPRNQELGYKGEVYATDEQGYYVYKKNKPFTSRKEGALDCSEIYPKRVGEITEVIVNDAEKNFYDFKDTSIPANLNYEDCLIGDEKMTVIFQDGMLAGKEFDVKYKHAERKFEILPQEIDGITMPDAKTGFVPVIGGKYAVFNVKMPDAYVCNNATKSGASWEMFRKAAEYLHDHADYLFTFNGTLDGIWAKKNWDVLRERLVPGGMILFSDNQFQPNGVQIRIVGIKDYLNDPHRPELELSNETVGQTVSGRIAQLETQEVNIEEGARSGRQYTKRTFRDAKETMQMLEGTLNEFMGEFTEGISPITINSMQMLVGSEQCQFEFVSTNTSNAVVVNPSIQYIALDANTGKLQCGEAFVRFSISENMSAAPEWKYAYINGKTLTGLEADKAYYIYVNVYTNNLVNDANTWECSDTALNFAAGNNRRRLLVGILDKDVYGNRSWCPMYGFTEITPGRIRVNKIISADGKTSFDLAQGIITGRINFTDGLISGLIGVAGANNQINAGMNGAGNGANAIRFWAGATEANMANAPFRVMNDGKFYAEQANIDGNVKTKNGGLSNEDIDYEYVTDPFGTVAIPVTPPVRFWAGKSYGERRSAPFRVYSDGSVYMNNAIFDGNISFTKESGYITGNVQRPFVIITSSNFSNYFTLEENEKYVFNHDFSFGVIINSVPSGFSGTLYIKYSGDTRSNDFIAKNYGNTFVVQNNTGYSLLFENISEKNSTLEKYKEGKIFLLKASYGYISFTAGAVNGIVIVTPKFNIEKGWNLAYSDNIDNVIIIM